MTEENDVRTADFTERDAVNKAMAISDDYEAAVAKQKACSEQAAELLQLCRTNGWTKPPRMLGRLGLPTERKASEKEASRVTLDNTEGVPPVEDGATSPGTNRRSRQVAE